MSTDFKNIFLNFSGFMLNNRQKTKFLTFRGTFFLSFKWETQVFRLINTFVGIFLSF